MNSRVARLKANHDRWLVSYADFITLLFAFFVVLYAFAKADQKRQLQVSAAIDSAFQSLSVAPGKARRERTGCFDRCSERFPCAAVHCRNSGFLREG